MADEKLLQIIRPGVAAWNDWRGKNPNVSHPDLSGAYLSGVNLTGADLREANLREADLSRANLTGANLNSSTIRWRIKSPLCLANSLFSAGRGGLQWRPARHRDRRKGLASAV